MDCPPRCWWHSTANTMLTMGMAVIVPFTSVIMVPAALAVRYYSIVQRLPGIIFLRLTLLPPFRHLWPLTRS